MRRFLTIVAAVAGAIVVLLVAAVALLAFRLREEREKLTAELSPFYNPPSPLPAGAPGEVIRVEPVEAPSGTQAWRVLYHSTTYLGQDIAVSALVVVPLQTPPAGGFPVVSVAHGTDGMARICAPSLEPFQDRLNRPSFFEQMIQPFTNAGYAVAATDYQGLGTPGVNPYLVGEDAGRNVLDAARMIRRLPNLALSDVTFIWGHSQGGQASAFAGQIAPAYAPELRIAGVVAGSPAAMLGLIAAEVESFTKPSPLTGLVVMIVRAWSVAYPDAEPDTALTARAVKRMGVVDRDCIDGVLLTFVVRPAPDYIKRDGLTTKPWPDLIERNTPGATRTPAPIHIFQGGSDPLIKPEFTQAFVKRLCAAGDTVSLTIYPGKGHLSVIDPSMPDTLSWMSDRLAGRPAPSSCGQT